jgi:hypothetical protein
MTKATVLIFAGLAAVVAACTPPRAPDTVSAELGAVPSSFSRVCVVRPSSVGAHVTMELKDNGRLVSATRGRTFACWLVMPGNHQITDSADDTGPLLLEARSGRQYFLHQDITTLDTATEGQRQYHAHLDWVDEPTATELIDRCNQRVMVGNISGHQTSEDGEAVAVPAR